MLVVLDTNVLISALLWHGKANQIIHLIDEDKIIPCFSQETLQELRGVLNRKKFKTQITQLGLETEDLIIPLLLKSELFKLPRSRFNVVKEDPSDNKFLQLALVAKVKCIVSGDKHLLKLENFADIPILSISEFLTFR